MKISILSAVHNESAHIDEMIRSVIAQEHAEWELLFVSDGSSDGTEDLIATWAGKDARIKVIGDGAKIGKVAAFNRAFEASTGDVVALLAGDDTIPPGSLAMRIAALSDTAPHADRVVAYFKLQTMSQDPSQDGIVLPRGDGASHSGGTITLTRALAEVVFPINEELISEDLWLTRAAEGIASDVRDFPGVVLRYRIHSDNSNPRNRSFPEMDRAMAARHRAWTVLRDEKRFDLSPEVRAALERNATLEKLRLRRQFVAILCYRAAPFRDRAACLSMASPMLFRLRRRFFRLLSGRRGR